MDTHYSYKPDTVAWVIHEHLPDQPVEVVERLAAAVEQLALEQAAEEMDNGCDGTCGYQDGRHAGIADAIAALEAL